MSKSKEQLNKLIDKIQQDLDDAKKQRDALDVTYSIGDRFSSGHEKVILGKVWRKKGNLNMLALTRLCSGETWNGAFSAIDCKRITASEIGDKLGCLTRYWDARKKVKTK